MDTSVRGSHGTLPTWAEEPNPLLGVLVDEAPLRLEMLPSTHSGPVRHQDLGDPFYGIDRLQCCLCGDNVADYAFARPRKDDECLWFTDSWPVPKRRHYMGTQEVLRAALAHLDGEHPGALGDQLRKMVETLAGLGAWISAIKALAGE